MPRFIAIEYEPGDEVEAVSAAQAAEDIHTIRPGLEYVIINVDDMSVTWVRGVVAAYNRNTEKVESLNGIG